MSEMKYGKVRKKSRTEEQEKAPIRNQQWEDRHVKTKMLLKIPSLYDPKQLDTLNYIYKHSFNSFTDIAKVLGVSRQSVQHYYSDALNRYEHHMLLMENSISEVLQLC